MRISWFYAADPEAERGLFGSSILQNASRPWAEPTLPDASFQTTAGFSAQGPTLKPGIPF